jgi:hypothetical protein
MFRPRLPPGRPAEMAITVTEGARACSCRLKVFGGSHPRPLVVTSDNLEAWIAAPPGIRQRTTATTPETSQLSQPIGKRGRRCSSNNGPNEPPREPD